MGHWLSHADRLDWRHRKARKPAVNVPLNDAIKAAGDPASIDVAQVRAQFGEARWAAWNLLRVATSVPAFGLLSWALVLAGRATA